MSIYLPIAEMNVNIFLIIFIGMSIGILSGIFGVGGGFLMTPLLIFLGIPPVGASEPTATTGGIPKKINSGVIKNPPPTPKIPESIPILIPIKIIRKILTFISAIGR